MKDIANTPLVSIICSTYNHGLYISQCLDGFLMQKTNFPFEILIHDDASTDNTPDIIREYEHNHPQVIRPRYLCQIPMLTSQRKVYCNMRRRRLLD